MIYDVIIIGAGPAGMSAAIYTGRKNLHTLILSKNIGGQTAASWEVDNYLGYHLVSGQELSKKFKEHIDTFANVEFKVGEWVATINRIDATDDRLFKITTNLQKEYLTKTIIIASGKQPRKLNIPGEEQFQGKGITYCATCDAPLFRDKVVAVVGGGNAALESVIQLSKIASKIHLLVREDHFAPTADQILIDKAKNDQKATILYNASIQEFIGDKFLSQIKINVSGQEKLIDVQGVFVEIGSMTSVSFIKGQSIGIALNDWDEIIIDKMNMTNVGGIFAAGDVTDVLEKQVVVAAGEGAKAAMQVAEWINRQK